MYQIHLMMHLVETGVFSMRCVERVSRLSIYSSITHRSLYMDVKTCMRAFFASQRVLIYFVFFFTEITPLVVDAPVD